MGKNNAEACVNILMRGLLAYSAENIDEDREIVEEYIGSSTAALIKFVHAGPGMVSCATNLKLPLVILIQILTFLTMCMKNSYPNKLCRTLSRLCY